MLTSKADLRKAREFEIMPEFLFGRIRRTREVWDEDEGLKYVPDATTRFG